MTFGYPPRRKPSAPLPPNLDALRQALGGEFTTPSSLAAAVKPINDNRAARDARTLAARYSLATDTLAALTSSGLTTTGGYVAASVGGTDGNAIYPVWGRKNVRASFRVKVTKATAGSKSAVGFTVSTPGVMPSASNYMFAVGYLQGSGIAIVRDNVGGAIVIVADAGLTDGEEYDVAFSADTELSARGTTTGILSALVTKVSTGAVTRGLANFNLTSFPINNMLVRTNVAAGSITNLQMTLHAAGETGQRSSLEVPYSMVAAETAFVDIPAKPNGKLVIACHGHGGTPVETGYTSALYAPTWKALTDAGFTIAVPAMGGDKWGNDAAQAFLAELHTQLTSLYGLDPDVFLWGNSMGGGAAQTAIAKKTIPVKAAYLAQPVCDLSTLWSNPSFSTLPAAYGNSTAERDDNNPIKQQASAFAGVPLLYVASAGDTTVTKSTNTDAMRTRLGSATKHHLITATGNHMDPSHYRPRDTLEFFRANIS